MESTQVRETTHRRKPRLDAIAAQSLLTYFTNAEPTTNPEGLVQGRQRLLESAATSLRLLIEPESDVAFSLLPRRTTVGEKLAAALEVMREHRKHLQELDVKVVGVHFLDLFAGRLSRIWPIYGWADEEYLKEIKGDFLPLITKSKDNNEEENLVKFFYTWIYSHLWMRVYWSVLRTTTTLINAFHEEILAWNESPLYFSWLSADVKPLDLEPAVSFTGSQHDPIRQIAKEFA